MVDAIHHKGLRERRSYKLEVLTDVNKGISNNTNINLDSMPGKPRMFLSVTIINPEILLARAGKAADLAAAAGAEWNAF